MAAFIRSLALVLVAAVLASGCGLLPEVKDETANWSAERLYSNAHDSLLEGNYTRAVKLFEERAAKTAGVEKQLFQELAAEEREHVALLTTEFEQWKKGKPGIL